MKSENSDEVLVVLGGPQIQFVAPMLPRDDAHCVMQAIFPPGFTVPLHSHVDRESFFLLSGELEGFNGDEWVTLRSGDIFDVPGGRRHAWRNVAAEPASLVVVTTARMGRFFREVGRRAVARTGPPSPEELQRFVETSARYEHWLGSPDDNAAVGIALPRPH
ncbi:MAG: cupin domain-containing protein [Verrucomicrobiota bacterium]